MEINNRTIFHVCKIVMLVANDSTTFFSLCFSCAATLHSLRTRLCVCQSRSYFLAIRCMRELHMSDITDTGGGTKQCRLRCLVSDAFSSLWIVQKSFFECYRRSVWQISVLSVLKRVVVVYVITIKRRFRVIFEKKIFFTNCLLTKILTYKVLA